MTGAGDGVDAEAVRPALSISEKLAQAMAELEATQAGVAEAEKELRHVSITVRSKDRAVEATVGAQGELTALRFLDNKYRTMAASELAASVLESVGQAKTQMARRVMETFKPFTEPSTAAPELTGVDIDWAKIFGQDVLEDPQDPRPATRRRRGRRLRDEINEDTEE
ncbi:YbaB/EbfC family nucleoid-associated protein [Streptomyces sp. NPDC057717]|uniref:YbaB/EbfC family nucleoid-associated protein n=1 Tax=Streptomyces sp. NPDC057717 TaxID=3346224 RepID=UPI0036A5C28B